MPTSRPHKSLKCFVFQNALNFALSPTVIVVFVRRQKISRKLEKLKNLFGIVGRPSKIPALWTVLKLFVVKP